MIASLPSELVSEVFRICVEELNVIPETLSQINRVLRHAALRTPRIWTHVYYEGPKDLERCRAFLERSGLTPLTLDLHLIPLSDDGTSIVEFSDVTTPHWPRIQDLRVAPYDGYIPHEDLERARNSPCNPLMVTKLTRMLYDIASFATETVMENPPLGHTTSQSTYSESDLDNFMEIVSEMPNIRFLSLTTAPDTTPNFSWPPNNKYQVWKLPALTALRLRGRSLGILTRLSTPNIRSIHVDMIEQGTECRHVQYLLRWLQPRYRTLEAIDILNTQRMNYIQGIWNDQDYLPLDDFICLKHLNATLPPWTMAHFLPFFGKATALAEVSLGLQLSTEHEPLVAVFEAISMTLRTAHIRSMAHASGDLLEMMEREYSVAPAARRITFPLLETFISDVYVGGVVIAATRQAPQLQFLALSSPNDRNEFDVSVRSLDPPFVEDPRLHTFIVNGFSPVCHSIDAPNLNRLNVLALKYPLSKWNTLWAYAGINIVRLITRFATSLQHLEIHEAIQGKARTKPHPHL
ncbi:hypothetical protein DL93DRAFT_2168727 [Clavulina sp. PMI_390]|nr:hypothetical protein DL93DRAFT_2168727 [Clavulina sp. PMI_390]